MSLDSKLEGIPSASQNTRTRHDDLCKTAHCLEITAGRPWSPLGMPPFRKELVTQSGSTPHGAGYARAHPGPRQTVQCAETRASPLASSGWGLWTIDTAWSAGVRWLARGISTKLRTGA